MNSLFIAWCHAGHLIVHVKDMGYDSTRSKGRVVVFKTWGWRANVPSTNPIGLKIYLYARVCTKTKINSYRD